MAITRRISSMGVGILPPSSGHGFVPGSVRILDRRPSAGVVRVPHPSNSPNDPLNWPWWKKESILLAISLGLGLTGVQGVCLSVVTGEISEELDIPLLKAEYLSSYQFLAVGAACAASAVAARLWAIWNALGTSYGSLLGSRIMYGLGCAAFESIGLATIGDLYFVHERGRRVSFYAFTGIMGSQLGPILGGYISDTYGWRIQLWMLTAYWSTMLLFFFFACPETSYRRDPVYETDILPADVRAGGRVGSSPGVKSPAENEAVETHGDLEHSSASSEKRRSYWTELLPVRGWETDSNAFKVCARVLAMGLYPIVWFTFIILATWLGWFIGISVTLAQIFGSPPASFSPTELGYTNAFGAVGATVAILWMHLLSDRTDQALARRNGGFHEPEFRLVMMIPAVITSVMGFALYGWYAGVVVYQKEISWIATSAIYGLIIFSLIVGESAAFGYLLDSHRDISVEASVFAIMLRQFFTYGAGVFMPLWIVHSGVATTFYILAGLHGALVATLTVLMYVFGKKIRAFTASHHAIQAIHVDVPRPHPRSAD